MDGHAQRSLLPDALAADFAPQSPWTRGALDALVRRLDAALADDGRPAARCFARWRSLFGASVAAVTAIGNARSLFCLHTYFALLLKVLAWRVLSRSPGTAAAERSFLDRTRDRLGELESGRLFAACGIANLLEGDVFSWYLDAWDDSLAEALDGVIGRLCDYDPATLGLVPALGRDLFKGLYTALVPRAVRHALGEYYTPDWLAAHTLSLLDPRLFPADGAVSESLRGRALSFRFLDPSCGSGTFLLAVIARIRSIADRLSLRPDDVLHAILANVVGFDLNPLAVLTARVNIALALAPLLPHRSGPVTIPVRLVDTLRLSEEGRGDALSTGGSSRFDLIAGNPPWINWESLPDGYRRDITPIWERYGLFPHHGMDTILGKGKKDVSALMTYVVADRLLEGGGRMAFVMTQSLLKTSGAGQGFRRFAIPRVGASDTPLAVLHVDDMVALKPFDGASNRTAVMLLAKGSPTRYPVGYTLWLPRRALAHRFRRDGTLSEVMAATVRHDMAAEPVDPTDRTSSWLTGRPETIGAVRKYLGRSPYVAHLGANTGGANAVYWLRVTERRVGGLVAVENVRDGAKRVVEPVATLLEATVVFPLLRASDIGRWRARPSASILFVQDPARQRGIAEEKLRNDCPRAHAYLTRFETALRERAAHRRYFTRTRRGESIDVAPFYSLFDVGAYTVAEWKVVWTRFARIEAAVVGPTNGRPTVPQETVSLVACDGAGEAYYLAGTINSLPFQFAACSYSQRGGKSMGSPHLLEYIRVPRFDPEIAAHRALAALSREAHARVAESGDLRELEERIDAAAGAVFGLDDAELALLRADSGDLFR